MDLPFVIAIAHKKGGVGKTTTAINISVELNKRFDLTCIDFDSQKQLTKFNNNRKNKLSIINIETLQDLINFLKSEKGLTIIDLGGYDSDLSRSALLFSDLVIIPLSDSDNDLDGLLEFEKIMNEVQKTQQSKIECCILTNRVHHRDKSTQKAFIKFVQKKSNFNVFDTIITQNSTHKRMLSKGKNVCELTNKDNKSYIQIQQLTKEIITRIKNG